MVSGEKLDQNHSVLFSVLPKLKSDPLGGKRVEPASLFRVFDVEVGFSRLNEIPANKNQREQTELTAHVDEVRTREPELRTGDDPIDVVRAGVRRQTLMSSVLFVEAR